MSFSSHALEDNRVTCKA